MNRRHDLSVLAPFRAARKITPALLSWTLVSSCGAVPMTRLEDSSLVQIGLSSPTRLLKPGDSSRFTVRIENRGEETLSVEGLSLKLEAWKTSAPPTRLESPVFPFHGLELKIPPGKHATIPLRPERQEFALDLAMPGEYQVRVTANERFTSTPLTLRVLPPRTSRR